MPSQKCNTDKEVTKMEKIYKIKVRYTLLTKDLRYTCYSFISRGNKTSIVSYNFHQICFPLGNPIFFLHLLYSFLLLILFVFVLIIYFLV